MHRLVPGTAARVRTFARLTALVTAGLTGPADRTLLALTPPPHPMRFRPVQTSAADAAGGTVTETITSAYRTGR